MEVISPETVTFVCQFSALNVFISVLCELMQFELKTRTPHQDTNF